MAEKLKRVRRSLREATEKIKELRKPKSVPDPVGDPCLNCGTKLVGDFCHSCGQSASVKRYAPGNFAKEIYQTLRSIDLTTSIKTGWKLIVEPGTFIRNYLAGQRVGFINPVKFFFYTFLIEVSAQTILNPIFNQGAAATATSRTMQIVDLVSLIFWGLLWRVFYRKSGFNIAESAAAAIYYQSAINFFETILLFAVVPIRFLFGDVQYVLGAIEIIPSLIYAYYFVYKLFQESLWLTIIKQTILTMLFFIVIIIVAIIAGLLVGVDAPVK